MTAKHFEEIVMTLIYTYGLTKRNIAKMLNVQPKTLSVWLKGGVPISKVDRVGFKLRKFVRERGNR